MLTDVQVRKAKPGPDPYKMADGGGLHLFVTPAGHRSWRWRYQRDRRERLIVLGTYPEMSLRQAREARDDARQAVRRGEPAGPKAAPTPPPTLAEVIRRWHALNAGRWGQHHASEVLADLERDIFPTLGTAPIDSITAPVLLGALRKVEARGAVDTAHRLRGRLSKAFAFAIAEGTCQSNPADALRDAMAPLVRKGHRPAVTTLEAARDVLRLAEAIAAFPVTRMAHRFLAIVAQRPGEVGGMEWPEIDGEWWRIPGPRMKMKRDHWVYLPPQAREAIEAIRPLTGRMRYVFPSAISAVEPMSENALSVFLRRAGFAGVHVPHGWRAAFSTIMNERYPADRHIIDLMLAHWRKDEVEAAYNRALHLDRRRELAIIWADALMLGMPFAADLMKLPRRSPNSR